MEKMNVSAKGSISLPPRPIIRLNTLMSINNLQKAPQSVSSHFATKHQRFILYGAVPLILHHSVKSTGAI